jgi:hypothetical protein
MNCCAVGGQPTSAKVVEQIRQRGPSLAWLCALGTRWSKPRLRRSVAPFGKPGHEARFLFAGTHRSQDAAFATFALPIRFARRKRARSVPLQQCANVRDRMTNELVTMATGHFVDYELAIDWRQVDELSHDSDAFSRGNKVWPLERYMLSLFKRRCE